MIVAPSQKERAGTLLYRVADPRFGLSYKWTAPAAPKQGGRFDCMDGSYGFSYFASQPDAALAEMFTRDLEPSFTVRTLPASIMASAVLVTVATNVELEVQVLHGPSLAMIGETTALTQSKPSEYDHTRSVAAKLVAGNPSAQGLRYRPRHNDDAFAYLLYSRDRNRELKDVVSRTREDVPLGSGDGLQLATTLLAKYNVRVEL